MIASIGLYTCLQNLISLLWGDDTKSIRTGEVTVGHEIAGAYVTSIQLTTMVISLAVFVLTWACFKYTKLGKAIRAVSSNPDLCDILGISTQRVIMWATAIGAGQAALVGILIALDVDMTPTMGFYWLLYGVIAMIIGGVGSLWGLAGGALLLAVAQHLGVYFLDSKWMDAIAFVILILFLIWKPLGFSGKKIRKIEI